MGAINVKCDNCGTRYSDNFSPPFSNSISLGNCRKCNRQRLRRDFETRFEIFEDRNKRPLRRVEIVFDSPEMPLG